MEKYIITIIISNNNIKAVTHKSFSEAVDALISQQVLFTIITIVYATTMPNLSFISPGAISSMADATLALQLLSY